MFENAARLAPDNIDYPGPTADTASFFIRPVLRELFAKLEARAIRYCHWKSNFSLADALGGDADVDLLIDREHASAFQAVILELDFKLCVSRSGKGHPGVFHAIALDEERLELVHLHGYFQIVSGDSLVKSYRFDVESRLLDRTRFLNGVRTPSPEAELVLLALRLALKHVHFIEILLARRDASKTAAEMQWLLHSCELNAAVSLCEEWFPEIGSELFCRIVSTFSTSDASLLTLNALGRSVASRLKRRRRVGRAKAAISRGYRVLTLLVARLSRRRDLVLQTSGMIVAIVGPKATGKSTLSTELVRRLSTCLDVQHIHAGKPPPTALTASPRLLLPLARKFFPNERPGEYDRIERREAKRYSWLYCVRMLLLAHDRGALLGRSLRKATAGTIIVSDRYPSMKHGVTDSSSFEDEALDRAGSCWKRWIMLRERATYRRMPGPGLVIRLVAPIETTILRDAQRTKEGGPDPDAISRRWKKEAASEFTSEEITISTDQSLDNTIAEVLKSVWRTL